MKSFAVLLLSALLAIGLVGGALAQTSTPPSGPGSTTSTPETKPDNPTDRGSDPAPAAPAERRDQRGLTAPDVKVDIKSESRDETGSALPRTTESRRIFGLSPTALVLIAAGLFVIVILALVSMTRGGTRETKS